MSDIFLPVVLGHPILFSILGITLLAIFGVVAAFREPLVVLSSSPRSIRINPKPLE